MKAKFILDLNKPEDVRQLKLITKAEDIAFVLFEIIYNLHKKARESFEVYKEQKSLPEDVIDELDMFYYLLNQELEERNIDVDEL